VDVIGVGDIALIRDALDHAEALLKALGKAVGSALQRRAVDGVVDVFLCLPLGGVGVQHPHDLKAQFH